MAGNVIDASVINAQAAADANYAGQFYAWVKKRLIQWQTNCGTAAQLAAYGITDANEQAAVLNLIDTLSRLLACVEGTESAANTTSLVNAWAVLQGIS